MLELDKRIAILKLAHEGHGAKSIARWLKISKNSVKRVLRDGRAEVPALERDEALQEHQGLIESLHLSCQGNLVRVHEELAREGVDVAYSTLTGFCRRHGIGVADKPRPGRYHFEPGEEMQHDTSPHKVVVDGQILSLQCASLILCFSRRQYVQVYSRWSRFEARVFLSEAIVWIGGSAATCMIDNSSVVISRGTGPNAIAAPEMKAQADRFGFGFVAHRVGDANRSGRFERPFHHIEHNFYPGRVFSDLADLNEQLRLWCETNFLRRRKRLQASPAQLFVTEAPHLRPLPPHVPEVYELHRRRVDIEGYVNLHTNRYSVDTQLIGRHLEVREGVARVRFFDGHRLAEEHVKSPYGAHHRETLPKHRGEQRRHRTPAAPDPKEGLLRADGPELEALVDALRKQHKGRATKALHQLHRIWMDYPIEAVRKAVGEALQFGLTDLQRIERMVLRHVAGDFFRLPTTPKDDVDDQEDEDNGEDEG
ncbi:MAG: hypothetical protein AUK47_10785 [Deltaproteobacteria bacterium CG2_30_63_29]|nr:MAG: hypothetical protein AUK47_10785 [Deltaproteobacteria bacterium CG2_30_63_29]PJB41231.1 MAG: integrase [Deltaproteobacteria bacterium CG_4_9_14_3_um_filter_63_12]